MPSILHFSRILEQRKGSRSTVRKQVSDYKKEIEELQASMIVAEKAKSVIQNVAQDTQKQLEFHISEIVSLALASVFDDPYEFVIDFVQRRNKTEADIYFVRNGKRVAPMDASGGGAIDVAVFALRVALWSIRIPKTRSTLLLDEPFRNLNRTAQPRAAKMIKELSNKLGIQMIMVSHNQDLIDVADKAFDNVLVKGVSKVKVIGEVRV